MSNRCRSGFLNVIDPTPEGGGFTAHFYNRDSLGDDFSKGKSSARGILAGYATPNLIPQEKSAFSEAMAEKHSGKLGGSKEHIKAGIDGGNNETIWNTKIYAVRSCK